MSTRTIERPTISHKVPANETPITLAEIGTHHPKLKPKQIEYIARNFCAVTTRKKGKRDILCCLPSEFNAAAKRFRVRRSATELSFTDRQGTWVAEEKLPGGIDGRTADRMYRDKLIRKPRIVPLDAKPWCRKFWHLEDVTPHVQAYSTPKATRDKSRDLDQLLNHLPDDEMVNRLEAKRLGFKSAWLTDHSDTQHPRRKRKAKPAKLIGGLIRGEMRDRIAVGDTTSYRRKFDPWYRLGDLRECIRVRDNPDVPAGGRLFTEALFQELAREGITANEKAIKGLIRKKMISGGTVTTYDKGWRDHESWWMKWEDRDKLKLDGRATIKLPPGGIRLRDAVARLKQERGITIGEHQLRNLIKAERITGGKIDRVGKRFNAVPASTITQSGPLSSRQRGARSLWWMLWSDNGKIRKYDKPGARFWYDEAGEDWHPFAFEAWRLAGLSSFYELRKCVAEEHGGFGYTSDDLGRLVTIRNVPIAHKGGDTLLACAGSDLRAIRQKRTGEKLDPPPKPEGWKAPARQQAAPPPPPVTPQAEGERAAGPRIILSGKGEPAIVDGKLKTLRPPGFAVVKALVDAADEGLSKDQLFKRSGKGDAWGILRRLCRDPDWKAVLIMPGEIGGRYRAKTSNPPKPTHIHPLT